MPSHSSQVTPSEPETPLPDRGLPRWERLAVLQNQFPEAAKLGGVVTIACETTASGLPLLFWKLPAKNGRPRGSVLLSAGIHGDEPAGVLALLQLVASRQLNPSLEWWIAPCLCPDAFLANQRNGPAGFDLNRDFKDARSPEVQCYRRILETIEPPGLHVSLHEDWEYDGAYFYEINSSGRPSLASPIMDALKHTIGLTTESCLDGHTVTAPGYILHPLREDAPGRWPESIYLARTFSVRSHTVETPSSYPLELRVKAACAAVHAASEAFLAEIESTEPPDQGPPPA